MDKIHQFQVLEIILLKSNFSRNECNDSADQENEDIPLPAQIKWNSYYDNEKKILKTILTASVGDEKSPLNITVEMGGRFGFIENPKDQHAEMLKNVNCPAIIFPYLREYVSDLTKRAGLTPLYLPPFNFVKAYKQKKADSEKK